MITFAATLAANSCPCPRGSWRTHEACPATRGLAATSLGLVRDTSGHVLLAVRAVNDHCGCPCGAGAQADCAVARSRFGDRSGLLEPQPGNARTVNQVRFRWLGTGRRPGAS